MRSHSTSGTYPRHQPARHVRLHDARDRSDAAPGWRRSGQHLSGAGIRGVTGGASYAASKHALIGLTKSAASTMRKRISGERSPTGNIGTPMMDRFTGGDIQKAIELEPVGRLGRPRRLPKAVLWMCSDLGRVRDRRLDLGRWRLVALSRVVVTRRTIAWTSYAAEARPRAWDHPSGSPARCGSTAP